MPSEEEKMLLSHLKTAALTGGIEDGTELYRTLKITGDGIPEDQIYSVRDLEDLILLHFTNESMYALQLVRVQQGYLGLDLHRFITACGASFSDDGGITIGYENDSRTVLSEEEYGGLMLALADRSGPIPLSIVDSDGNIMMQQVDSILAGHERQPGDPGYKAHDHEPYLGSQDIEFTVEVYREGEEYLGAVEKKVFTTAQLEELMQSNPEQVREGYYGTIGDSENYKYVGVGGWFDHFEGIDLYWLLTEQAGIRSLSGRAELYDRDGEMYTEISDLAYLTQAEAFSDEYYTLTAEGLEVHGMVPMIGLIKNGAPILADHTHEGLGYIAYNTFNQYLESNGIGTEIGVIKNHNGPFIACLGNRTGFYGGNQVETGNNCVLIKLFIS